MKVMLKPAATSRLRGSVASEWYGLASDGMPWLGRPQTQNMWMLVASISPATLWPLDLWPSFSTPLFYCSPKLTRFGLLSLLLTVQFYVLSKLDQHPYHSLPSITIPSHPICRHHLRIKLPELHHWHLPQWLQSPAAESSFGASGTPKLRAETMPVLCKTMQKQEQWGYIQDIWYIIWYVSIYIYIYK